METGQTGCKIHRLIERRLSISVIIFLLSGLFKMKSKITAITENGSPQQKINQRRKYSEFVQILCAPQATRKLPITNVTQQATLSVFMSLLTGKAREKHDNVN